MKPPSRDAILAVLVAFLIVVAGGIALYAFTPERPNPWPTIGQWTVGFGPTLVFAFLAWLRGENVGRAVGNVQDQLNGTLDGRIESAVRRAIQQQRTGDTGAQEAAPDE